MSADSIAEQTQLLAGTVCPEAEDPDECEALMYTWWEGIGKYQQRGKHVCSIIFYV